MWSTTIARWEGRLRPLLSQLPAPLAVAFYSSARRRFLLRFSAEIPRVAVTPSESLARTLWGLEFRSTLVNAAGIFKNGDGYEVCWRQGAGAYLAGTSTQHPRRGNRSAAATQPFAPYPRSGAASNFLGLPNLGHRAVAKKLAGLERRAGFPIGASVASTQDDDPREETARLESWVEGLRLFDEAGVDFLEINESCPNTADGAPGVERLQTRLAYLSEHFLRRRQRSLPTLVKFSCDTALEQVPQLVSLLDELGFYGVNFGNTSIAYTEHRGTIDAAERTLYDHFTQRFGGGLSGRPLKGRSLRLAAAAVEDICRSPPSQEFHVVRTGGIETADDVRRSEEAGISLNQWYSGYFEAFGHHGHALYRRLYHDLLRA